MKVPKRKGQSFASTYTAGWYNWVNRELLRLASRPQLPQPVRSFSNTVEVSALPNDEDELIKQYDVVRIVSTSVKKGGPDISNPQFSNVLVKVTKEEISDRANWGVALTPIHKGASGFVAVGGMTWVKMIIADEDHKWVTPTSNSESVISGYSGSAYIVAPPEDGSAIGLINIMGPSLVLVKGNVATSFSGAPSTFKVNFTDHYGPSPIFGSTNQLTNMTVNNVFGWEEANVGSLALVVHSTRTTQWDCIQLEC